MSKRRKEPEFKDSLKKKICRALYHPGQKLVPTDIPWIMKCLCCGKEECVHP